MGALFWLSDEQWAAVEPHLPKKPARSPPGRRQAGDLGYLPCAEDRLPLAGLPGRPRPLDHGLQPLQLLVPSSRLLCISGRNESSHGSPYLKGSPPIQRPHRSRSRARSSRRTSWRSEAPRESATPCLPSQRCASGSSLRSTFLSFPAAAVAHRREVRAPDACQNASSLGTSKALSVMETCAWSLT